MCALVDLPIVQMRHAIHQSRLYRSGGASHGEEQPDAMCLQNMHRETHD
jgi:hypothetical protein